MSCPICNHPTIGLRQYTRHVGRHLEQVALFSLPSLGQDAGDSGEENNTDSAVSDSETEDGQLEAAQADKQSEQSSNWEDQEIIEDQDGAHEIKSNDIASVAPPSEALSQFDEINDNEVGNVGITLEPGYVENISRELTDKEQQKQLGEIDRQQSSLGKMQDPEWDFHEALAYHQRSGDIPHSTSFWKSSLLEESSSEFIDWLFSPTFQPDEISAAEHPGGVLDDDASLGAAVEKSNKADNPKLGSGQRPDIPSSQEPVIAARDNTPWSLESKRAVLSKALQKANTAIELDKEGEFDEARNEYAGACNLIHEVLKWILDREERRRLSAILKTYETRIAELPQSSGSQDANEGSSSRIRDLDIERGGHSLPTPTQLEQIDDVSVMTKDGLRGEQEHRTATDEV